MQAIGGRNSVPPYFNGGGGRIAVNYGSLSGFTSAQLYASGANYFGAGGPGTIFTKAIGQPHGDLRIDNSGTNTSAQPTLVSSDTFNSLSILGGAGVRISGDLTVESAFSSTSARFR